jgi:hypothetical protein
MTRMTDSWDNRAARHQQALKAAAARIRPARHRLSDQEAEQIVAHEFSVRGLNLAAPGPARVARSLLHPGWPLLHPIKARREGWSWRSSKDD